MSRLLSSEVAKPSIDLTNHENSKNEMQLKLREKLDQIPQPLDTGHSEVLKVNDSRTLTNSHGTVTMAKLKQGTRKLGKLTKICIWNCRSLCGTAKQILLVGSQWSECMHRHRLVKVTAKADRASPNQKRKQQEGETASRIPMRS